MNALPFCTSFLLLLILPLFFSSSSAQKCASYAFSDARLNPLVLICTEINELKSYLYWNIYGQNVFRFAYRQTGARSMNTRFVGWTLAPSLKELSGYVSFFCMLDGEGVANLEIVNDGGPGPSLSDTRISYRLLDTSCSIKNEEAVILVTMQIGSNRTEWNITGAEGSAPPNNDENMESKFTVEKNVTFTVDFKSKKYELNEYDIIESVYQRDVHIILSMIGWGVLIPLGAMVARYLKVYNLTHSSWFHIHRTCQTISYVVAAAGWGYGIKLGVWSRGIEFYTHKMLGIIQFSLATIQAFSFTLRPSAHSECRIYWNAFHHTNGYAIIFVSVLNIVKGFSIIWYETYYYFQCYIAIVVVLAIMVPIFDYITRLVIVQKETEQKNENYSISAGTKPLV